LEFYVQHVGSHFLKAGLKFIEVIEDRSEEQFEISQNIPINDRQVPSKADNS